MNPQGMLHRSMQAVAAVEERGGKMRSRFPCCIIHNQLLRLYQYLRPTKMHGNHPQKGICEFVSRSFLRWRRDRTAAYGEQALQE
jgi:hypothetical protein